ncbi:hypothetical protein MTR67_020348 [Solanum verrucosum]|uniref:Uncharacterized protein n=1 Tax=Solanum verrucosum TaxID=315347 RepID=A0AAF0TVQ9_SOLVR|nr:hypothetical protein MTR67_020348 [Solanum verrucosum]
MHHHHNSSTTHIKATNYLEYLHKDVPLPPLHYLSFPLVSVHVDLITTVTKLSSLGQVINYEAYTYPPRKIDVTKLKL